MFEMRSGRGHRHSIEPHERLHIRFRIDGLLQPQTERSPRYSAVAQRLKLMSVSISERRLPQTDAQRQSRNQQITCAFLDPRSTASGRHAPAPPCRGGSRLTDLGMPPEMLERFSKASTVYYRDGARHRPHRHRRRPPLRCAEQLTSRLQDHHGGGPVEYRLDGLNQVQSTTRSSSHSAAAAFVSRQIRTSSDREMRDLETAESAARRHHGHMVLSTLHTPDAASAPCG